MSADSTDLRAALERIFALDSHKEAVVIRTTPGHLADEVVRELAAQGFALASEMDVGRLRAAMQSVIPDSQVVEGWSGYAPHIAHEYARLASEEAGK